MVAAVQSFPKPHSDDLLRYLCAVLFTSCNYVFLLDCPLGT